MLRQRRSEVRCHSFLTKTSESQSLLDIERSRPQLSPTRAKGGREVVQNQVQKALCNISPTWEPEKQVKPKAHPALLPSPSSWCFPGPVVPRCQGCPSTCSAQALPAAPAVPCLSRRALTQNGFFLGTEAFLPGPSAGPRLGSGPPAPFSELLVPQDAMHFGLGYFLEVGRALCTKASSFLKYVRSNFWS